MILSDVNNDQTAEFGQESPKTQLLSDVTKETRVSFDEFKKMGHTAPEYESDAFDRLYGGIDNQLRQMMTVGNQLKVFGGQVQMSLGDMFGSDNLIERGRSNIQTASRNLDKQLADIDLAKFPVSQKDQESFVYGLGSGVANYGVMLVGGYGSGALLKAVGAGAKAVSATTSAVGIGSMAALEVGGETQEGLDIYKQRMGDTELKNITPEWAKKEAATTALYGVASGIIEKKFGFGAQRKMFKSPLTFIKGASKTALSEGATEALQELTNAGIDLADGSITWEQLPERIRGAMMEGAIGAVIGGSAGVSVAYAQRANGVKYIKEQIKNTVPVKDQDVVAKSIYDDGVKTLSDVISRELELSSEMQAQHGLVWDNMNKAVKSAIDDSIAQGNEFFSRKSEDSIAEYVTSTSKLFADQVLAEANKRGMLIQDVLDGAKIEYADGKIYLKGKNFTTRTLQTTRIERPTKQISLLQFIRSKGGVIDEGGELKDMDARKQFIGLVNKNGMSLDAAGEALWQAGYFSERPTVSEVLDAIDSELRGNKKYPLGYIEETQENTDIDYYISDYAGAMGYDLSKMSYEEKTQIYEQMQRNLNSLDELDIDNTFFQESIDIAKQNEELDAKYPAYEGETIAINGQEKTVYNSSGERIAKSKEALENFYKWFGDSKVVDEQGRPLVVYHGSDANFDVFDRTKTRSTMDIQGNFFSPWELDASGYGANVRPFYLKITNPASSAVGYKTLKKYQGQNDAGIKAREELEKMGYDGVNNDDEEYIAFNSNQIKSTQNRGTYSESDNIYYQEDEEITENLLRDIKKTLTKPVSSEVLSKTISTLNKTQGGRGYTETGDSVQAEIARSQGLATAQEISKAFKNKGINISISTIENSQVADEWHHIGKNMKKTNFYDVENFDIDELLQEQKQEIREKERDKLFKDNVKKLGLDKLKDDDLYKKYQEATGEKYGSFDSTVRMFDSRRKAKNYLYSSIIQNTQTEFEQKNKVAQGTYSDSENIYYQSAFAGSRVDYDRPSLEAIGSGEGAQAHGWGLYYALNKDVAEGYREAFTKGQSKLIIGDKSIEELINSYDWNNEDYDIADNMIDEITRHLEFRAKNQKDTYEARQSVLQDIGNYIQDLRGYLKKGSDDEVYIKHVKEDLENAEKLRDKIATYNAKEFKFEEQKGQVHEVDIPENPYLLDEELTFRNQSEFVQNQLKKIISEENLTDKFEIYQSEENPKYNILENSDGEEIYKTISKALGSDKAASQLLEKYGIKGITYDGRQDGRCFVIFNPADVKVIQKFYQGSSRASRGEYNVSEQAIKIAETADFSTLPHELAHFWLDNQFKYIQSGLASQEYIDGFNPIKRYLGISDNQTVIKRYQQEKFARAYEKYLRTKELPDPMLKSGFDKYNKWLRMVYRDANKIRYRNEDGKLVTPKLTEDAVRFFRSMTTGYLEPPVNVVPTRSEAIKQEDAKQKAEGERYMVREIERPTPIVEQTSIKTDKFGKGTSRVYERETGQTLEYNKINLKDQEQRANELVKTDLNKARRIALGFEKADDLTQTAVNIAYRNEMKAIGNINEYAKALEYGSIAQTMRGQEISAERIGIKSPDTVEFWYDKAQYAKTQKVADKVYKSVDKEVFDNKVEALNALMKKKAKELADKLKTAEDKQKVIEDFQKSLQEEFDILYQEDFEDLDDKNIDTWAQRFVEKNFNVLPTEQEIEVINSKIDNLRELAESLEDANGNPSLEALRAYDQMNKYIESLNPSNDLAVFTSVVARGSMLASVKSPILNIVSNAETLLSEGITNRITTLLSGGSLENVVDSKLKSDYLKYGANAYRVSGFNISTAQDLNFERLVTGEKIITTQGEGAFKKFAQKIETGVFKYAMGFPDSISKDIAFVDRVSLECSNVARKEGLKGEALKNRANKLFRDAIRIEPMTEEGEVIRKHGISYAHKATFTDDNALSQGALAIRDALNKLSGDLRAGDNLMPFVKTPASVINIGLEYTAGVVYMMPKLDVILRDVKRGEISDVSRQAINSGVRNGLGLLLAYMIAGALDDDDYIPAYEDLGYGDTLLLKEKNVVYNSIKIGDKYVSLDYLGPIGVPVAGILGAKRSNGFGAFSGNVLSQFLRLPGVKDFADTVSGLSKMTKQTSEKNLDMLQQEAIDFISARTVPALVSDIAKAMDSYERDMSNDVWDRLKGKIPVLREELPKVYSKTTGEAVKSNGLLTLFVGSRVKEAQSNKIIREIEGIKSQGESVSLSDPTKYGDLRLLDKDDKIDIRKRFAEEYAERVLRTIDLPSFETSSVERKAKLLNNARRHTVSKIKIDYRNKLLEKKRSS